MPKGSCLRTTLDERLGEDWTVTDDLLALLIEVTSITATDRKLKKPIEVPRPKSRKPGNKPPQPAAPATGSGRAVEKIERDVAFKKGIGVLAASSRGAKK